MKKQISIWTQRLSSWGVLFLLFFIPIYPKLPLLDIRHTWVYIRLEDFIILFIYGLFIINLLIKKKYVKTSLNTPILIYFFVGFVSLINSIVFIRPILTEYFPHLAILHYIRRLEYIGLFFVAFEAFRTEKYRIWAMRIIACTLTLVVAYGIGQKFLGFPAFLTMNEEFAKGIPLRLPPTARIPSTFSGHYDLAAYLVLMIPLLGSLVVGVPGISLKLLFLVLYGGGYLLLLYTASRVSFGVYLVAVSMMLWWHKKRWMIPIMIIGSIVLMQYISGVSERFYKTLRFTDVIVDLSTGRPIGTLEKIEGGKAVIEEQEAPDKENLPKGTEFITLNSTQPTQPIQIIKTIERYKSASLATGSGEISTASGSYLIQKALVYDISITTRFQGQWPKALAAFKRNILLGSGFSTLSIASDSDYMRMLGETGLLGTFAFLGIFFMAFMLFFKNKDDLSSMDKSIVIGIFAGIFGLFINAILIDVFEASKIAYNLWILLGLALAIIWSKNKRHFPYFNLIRSILTHYIVYMIFLSIAVFLVYRGALSIYFLADDFTWLKWAASCGLKDIPKMFTDSQGFFYRPLPKLWYFILYSIFWLKPVIYHVASLTLFSGIICLIYKIMRMLSIKNFIAITISLVFITLSIHHENIFWISGHSSLLSAFFLFSAICINLSAWQKKISLSFYRLIFSQLCLFFAMISYEGGLIAPIVFVFIGLVIYRRFGISEIIAILLVPLYWWVRQSAGSLYPSGDYGIHWNKLIVNSVGNTIGYFISILVGPKGIGWFLWIRGYLKPYYFPITLLLVFIFSIFITIYYYFRRQIKTDTVHEILWLGAGIISLLPFLGLGGISERYTLVASGFFIIALGILLDRIWDKRLKLVYRCIIIGLVVLLGFYNYFELQKLDEDWHKASSITESSLLTIRSSFFPLQLDTHFIIINNPIRYGRAWIFPTGIHDALWHIFHLGPSVFTVVNVKSPEEAYSYKIDSGQRFELIFEDYVLKRAVKEIETIVEQN